MDELRQRLETYLVSNGIGFRDADRAANVPEGRTWNYLNGRSGKITRDYLQALVSRYGGDMDHFYGDADASALEVPASVQGLPLPSKRPWPSLAKLPKIARLKTGRDRPYVDCRLVEDRDPILRREDAITVCVDIEPTAGLLVVARAGGIVDVYRAKREAGKLLIECVSTAQESPSEFDILGVVVRISRKLVAGTMAITNWDGIPVYLFEEMGGWGSRTVMHPERRAD